MLVFFSSHPTYPYRILIYCAALLYTRITHTRRAKKKRLFKMFLSFLFLCLVHYLYIILYSTRFYFVCAWAPYPSVTHTHTHTLSFSFSLCPTRIFYYIIHIIYSSSTRRFIPSRSLSLALSPHTFWITVYLSLSLSLPRCISFRLWRENAPTTVIRLQISGLFARRRRV